MTNKTKKVICINGDESKLYEQVIFIMKDNNVVKDNKPIDFVSEAEKIINGYVKKEENVMKNENKDTFIQVKDGIQQLVIRKSKYEDVVINTLILISCIGLSFALLYILK